MTSSTYLSEFEIRAKEALVKQLLDGWEWQPFILLHDQLVHEGFLSSGQVYQWLSLQSLRQERL
jgi:hypothetical protein